MRRFATSLAILVRGAASLVVRAPTAAAAVAPERRRGRRRRGGRIALVLVLAFSLWLLSAAPQPGVILPPADGQDGWPLSWLTSLFPASAWADPGHDGPKQGRGTASYNDHYVASAQTRASGGKGAAPAKGRGELGLYQPHTSAAKAFRSEQPRKKGFDKATSRRLADKATATSDLYANADGSYTRKVYQEPVNFKAANGSWTPIDTGLKLNKDKRWHTTTTPLGTDFADSAAAPDLVSLRGDSGWQVGFGLRDAAPVSAAVKDRVAVYAEALPQTDLQLQSISDGVKETIVLNSADAPTSWVFPLRLNGLTPKLAEDGSVEFTNSAGSLIAKMPRGYMFDSYADPHSSNSHTSRAVAYALVTDHGAPAVRVSVDATWLKDPARVFPVMVDPTLVNIGVTNATYVENDFTGDQEWDYDLRTGSYDWGSTVARSFLLFNGLGGIPAGSHISGAWLNLYNIWSWTCTPEPFDIYQVASGWSPSMQSWWDQPALGAWMGSVTADPGSACYNSGYYNYANGTGTWMQVPIANLDPINAWSTGASPNYGMSIVASLDDATQWKKFTSAVTGTAPNIWLQYDPNVAPAVTNQFPPDNYSATTLQPELMAAATGDDNWPNPVTYQFRVYDVADTQNPVDISGWLSAGDYVVPAGKLTWGKTYLWAVQVTDGFAYSDIGPSFRAFTTAVPQPLVTSHLAQNPGGRGFDPSVGNYTMSATDAQVSTVGPALTIDRSYNSLDPRTASAFGTGWSSILDARATEQYVVPSDPSKGVASVLLTYPTGQEVAFGRNSDGTFVSGQGRFASYAPATGGGYTMTDKNGTTYTFGSPTGVAGTFGLTSISDASNRTLSLTYVSGRASTITSASGRKLKLGWTTPTAPARAHIATVTTDPATPGDASTAATWSYVYSGDQLASVCPPTSATACTTYTYTGVSQYANTVLDTGPSSYWRFNDPVGTAKATNSAVANLNDRPDYTGVALGQTPAVPGSTSSSASFNGTSSYVRLPNSVALETQSSAQTISMWFKTSTPNGVLFSYQAAPITNATTTGNYTPALYIGQDGHLVGQYWCYNPWVPWPMQSSTSVADGAWHHVVLSSEGKHQVLYLDGAEVGHKDNPIQLFDGKVSTDNMYIGAGYLGGWWPDQPHQTGATDNSAYATYFNGAISDVAFYNKPLSVGTVQELYASGHTATPSMATAKRPSGKTFATVGYDTVSGRVGSVTDSNGGNWTIGNPGVQGSSKVYASAVQGSAPAGYWRLGETTTGQAQNEVNGGVATYNNVTLASTGAFGASDDKAGSFNGTSSSMRLPAGVGADGALTAELWFKTTTATGMLLAYQQNPLGGGCGDCQPALYVGNDGRLHGGFWTTTGPPALTSATTVTDGAWHHAVLVGGGTTQTLYLDGANVGDATAGTINVANEPFVYVGAGRTGTSWPAMPDLTDVYFNGVVDEVALYRRALDKNEVAAHWTAYKSSFGVALASTVDVHDPANQVLTYGYDVLHGSRPLYQVDALHNRTTYGYDTSGFLATVTDANGNVATTGHDARGNVVRSTACQNFATNTCSTVYNTYFPDATTTTLDPDARNDLLLTTRDGRSQNKDDPAYLTTFTYDTAGNRTAVTTPPVPGFPGGRVATTSYTNASSVAADGGTPPAGLPSGSRTPGGAIQSVTYYRNGDMASVTDAAGQVTTFTYDGIGRLRTQTTTSDTYPSGLTTTYTYDALGQVSTETGPPVTNRVTGAIHQSKTTTTYDDDGNTTSITAQDLTGGDASRTVSMTYNTYDQLTTTRDPAGAVTTLVHDAYGNKIRQINASNVETDFSYDPNRRLLTTTLKGFTGDPVNPSPATDKILESRAYDPAGRLATLTDAMQWVTAYAYFDNGQTATITRKNTTTGASFVEQSNTYDAAGDLITQVTGNGATKTSYTVDKAGRETGSVLDPGGLRRTTTSVFSPDDAVLTSTVSDGSGASTVTDATYDALGRMTSRTVHNDGAAKPAGWWKLDETRGSYAVDSSGAGQVGIGTNVTWSGGAATFNGTSSTIATAGPALNTTQGFTVSVWVKSSAFGSDWQTAVSQDGVKNSAFDLEYDPEDNRWSFSRLSNDTASATGFRALSSSAPTAGVWVHLVGVFDSNNGSLKLYVNGAANGTATDPTPFNASGGLVIGRGLWDATPSNFFNGSIDNVQVYPRAISPSEVSTLYSAGRAGSALAANRSTTTWALDQRGLPTTTTDPTGNTTTYTYDELGRLAVTSLPTVNTEVGGGTPVASHPVWKTGYDNFGSTAQSSDPNGNVTTVAYDAAGRAVSTTLPSYTPPGTSTAIVPVSSATYNLLGQVVSQKDPLNHTTTFLYDQLGRLAKATAPNNGVTRYTYNDNSQLLSATDPTGAVAQSTYDYLGRTATATAIVRQPTTATDTTTYTYNDTPTTGGGRLSTVASPTGVTTRYAYNAAGQPTSMTDGANNVTQYSYDFAGRPSVTRLADGTSATVTYDGAGHVIANSQRDASGAVLTTRTATYDAAGRPLSATDALGHATTLNYDAGGRLSGVVLPVSSGTSITASFGYDAAGNRTRFTDGRGNAFVSTYNRWGLLESTIEPATTAFPNAADRTFTLTYDAAGELVSRTSPGSVKVTNTYDVMGNLTGQSGTGAEVTTTARTLGYDLAGRPTSASAPGGTDTFTHDDRGALLSTAGPSGTSSFAYNADGAMTKRTDASGTTTYGYDTAGRLSTLSDPITTKQLSYAYNVLNQPTSVTYGSGGDTRNYGYDAIHQLTSDTVKTASGTSFASITYGYNLNGDLTAKTTAGVSGAAANTYTYDWARRLTSWTKGSTTTNYGYDASGNRTAIGSKTLAYDQRNELTSDATNTYTYTKRGTLATSKAGTVTTTTKSDAFDQVLNSGSRTYSYDALSRLLKVTGGTTVNLTYSGADNLVASDGATYSRDPAGSVIGLKSGTSAQLAWTDQHTDLVGLFSPTGTSLAGSRTYDPLGTATNTSAMLGQLGYQSGWTDPTTSRVNMAARWYNPGVGQFNSRDSYDIDPAQSPLAANRYSYVSGNPMLATDPTGHCSWYDVVCGVKAVASVATNAYNTYVAPVVNYVYDNYIEPVVNYAVNTITSIVDTVVDDVTSFVQDPLGTITDAYHAMTDVVGAAWDNFEHNVTTFVDDVKDGWQQVKTLAERGLENAAAVTAAAWNAASTWVEEHQADIVGFVAGTLVFLGCEFATGGAGSLGCAALAGAAGSMATYAWKTAVQHEGEFSVGGLLLQGAIGAAVGALTGGAGRLLGAAFKGAIGELGNGASGLLRGLGNGLKNEGRALANEVRSSVAGAANRVGNLFARDAATDVADGAANRVAGEAADMGVQDAEQNALGAAEKCLTNSFAPATPVLLADGTTKAIGDITVGDKVTATDPVTGQTAPEPVTVLHANNDTELTDLSVATDTGTETLHTTQGHPFWDDSRQEWVKASDLKIGEKLHTSDHRTATVFSVRSFSGAKTMHNLTVADIHTYYVLAGDQPVLVHNCGGPACACATEGFPSYDKPGGWLDAMGPARDFAGPGETLNWEHVVEQSQALKSGFPQEWINHPDNMMLLDSAINFAKNGYYSKTFNWTGGQSIRKMLTGMPFNQQWDFGMYVINTIKTFGKEGLPGNL